MGQRKSSLVKWLLEIDYIECHVNASWRQYWEKPDNIDVIG